LKNILKFFLETDFKAFSKIPPPFLFGGFEKLASQEPKEN